jgi:hypothetical protein
LEKTSDFLPLAICHWLLAQGMKLRFIFQRGEKWKEFSIESPKALLPLKKGGREGFLAGPFQSAKALHPI